MSKDTLVLALGNPLRGDDGLGARACEMLAEFPLPGGVSLLDGGTPGLETVLLLQGYHRVVIIDAAEMGLKAGEWRRFMPDEATLGQADLSRRGTLHAAGLAEALTLAEALGVLPAEITIYGVQPAGIGWEPGLSAPVEAALPAVCAAIVRELGIDEPVNV
ncbi:MAG: hydrogenase maturation protease [Anaerolineae bacterium]|nr:hydrogenase maturation protease [Anaerolineae bacterium]